jgi:hypothetical protein
MSNIGYTIVLNNDYKELPAHVSDIVMSYFEGTPSAFAIRKNRLVLKNKIICIINNSISTRNNPRRFHKWQHYNEEENNEHWIYCFNDCATETLQLQACNCTKCGNYNYPLSFEHTNKIVCICKRNSDWYM